MYCCYVWFGCCVWCDVATWFWWIDSADGVVFGAGDCCVGCLILIPWCGVFVGTGFGLVGCGVLFIFGV